MAFKSAAFALMLAACGIGTAAAENVTYVHTDTLGSPVLETDEDANVLRWADYSAYGEVLGAEPVDGPGYTSHYSDTGTGLVYMQQRYYDPAIGRFLSVDPVTELTNGDMRHFNRFAYAYNSPLNFTDPDGRCGACDRHNDQYVRDFAAGNSAIYDPMVKPAAAVATAALPGGPLIRVAVKAIFTAYRRQKVPGGDSRPNGVPKDWIADSPGKGPGTIYRNPENPKHDTVRVVPGRPENSQPGQQVDHVIRTANGRRYGEANAPVPTRSQESHVPADKFKFVPADKLPKN